MKKNLLIFFLLFGLIYFFTNGLLSTFFQQDEWNGFGLVTSYANSSFLVWFGSVGGIHFFPLGMLFWALLYKIFGINSQYFALTALTLHAIASLLVYLLAKKLSNNWVGILTTVLFATNGRASQAFTHLAIFPATITSFIAIIIFFLYVVTKMKKIAFEKKDLIILLLLFIISVSFREDGLILPPLFLVFLFIYNKKALNKKNLWFFSIFYLTVGLFFLFRLLLQIANPGAVDISTKSYLSTYLYNGITFPVKLFVQNIVDGYYGILLFLYRHAGFFYPIELSAQIKNSVLLDLAFLIVFNVIIFIFLFFTKSIKQIFFWKNILFSCFFIFVSAALLASIGRRMDVIESRYLYLSSFAVLFALSLFLNEVYKGKTKSYLENNLKRAAVLLVVVLLLITSYSEIKIKINKAQAIGNASRQILSDIKKLHPTIPKKTIFFVKCKGACHRNIEFGLPNSIVLPFSSGPGWIILLHYSRDNENTYAPFFTRYNGWEYILNTDINKYEKVKNKEFLWDYGAEGYRTVGDYSFGYFINMNLLKNTLKKENLNKDTVIGLEYDEQNFRIKDISEELQKEL